MTINNSCTNMISDIDLGMVTLPCNCVQKIIKENSMGRVYCGKCGQYILVYG